MNGKIASTIAIGFICTLAGSIAPELPAIAGTLSASDIVNDWVRFPDPRASSDFDAWTVFDSDTIRYTENRGQTLASDFIVDGSFSFKSRIQNVGDDDRYGLVFGFQDAANNYRLSWEGRFANGGFAEADGSRGLSLIREVGGITTSLFNLDTTVWQNNAAYDITVQRLGSDIGFSIEEVGNGIIASTTVTDTTFTSGRLGLWNSSQRTDYTMLTFTPTPEPSALLGLLTLGGVGACGALLKRRQTSKG